MCPLWFLPSILTCRLDCYLKLLIPRGPLIQPFTSLLAARLRLGSSHTAELVVCGMFLSVTSCQDLYLFYIWHVTDTRESMSVSRHVRH